MTPPRADTSAPLVVEFGFTKEIEDRLLAPISIAGVASEKILVGIIQALIAGLFVLPLAWLMMGSHLNLQPGNLALLVSVALLSGWLFAAILSFNEFTASLFVTAQRTQTLPVAMYNYVREYADPTMAALSVIFIVVTAMLLTIANVFLGLGKVLNVEQAR